MTERKIRKCLIKALPIETERLIIRHINTDDAYDMYEYASIPEVSQYLLWSPHINLSSTEGYIEALQKRYLKGLYADWAIELKENHKMIGTCGYASIDSSQKQCEIGYVLSPYFRGKGYMTEAVKAILELSFENLEFGKATLRIIKENQPSINLANRLNFTLIYKSKLLVKDVERDILHYFIAKEEYKK